MFYLISKEQLAPAIARCMSYRPRVARWGDEEGLYTVSSQSKPGRLYMVEIYRSGNRRVVNCNCPTRDGHPCKHAAAALALHLVYVANGGTTNGQRPTI